MSPADARLCFEAHATSKIQSMEDLFRVQTMGFRGEAMASIAAVAQIVLRTKRVGDENGVLIEVWGGEEEHFEPVSMDDGASITVGNRFYNVPDRYKIIKTYGTDMRHNIHTLQ